MMEKNFFKPDLRFPVFQENWKKFTLGKVATKITDGTHDTPKPVNSGVPFLTAIHVKDGKLDFENCYFLPKEIHDKIYARCNPEYNDILMVNIGAGTGACARVNVDFEFSLKNVALIKPDPKKVFPSFLEQLQRENTKRLKQRLSAGGAQPFLSLKEIGKIKISLPSLPEQQKIASFLSSVDERIELLERKKEKLKAYKKGVMQQIFPSTDSGQAPQIRFKQDDGSEFPDWEEKRLGEVAKVFSGGTPKSSVPELYGGNIPFIRSGEINASTTELTLTEKGLKSSSAKMVEKGDLLLAIYGATSGEAGISRINGAINQAVLCIRWTGENVFLLNWLKLNKTALTQKYLQGGQGNLSGEIVKSFELNVPCREEQKKIAAFLNTLDENLETLDSQIHGLRTWKKGLLQQMFV
ncbi:Type I restriction-modification system, specificity subunit S [Indibacter alkaliphilus LW1]|uniref:Type I restriction-modification system, specificity subunit S n=1 Tax=Indibacter alkaliphilus (strain CCUG 57479 / KCTC 22604 / LW1) TaxID=1189612 RepID=S2E5U5_INDAL|nr:restriction endonuclease subunit S [Indibacter alkaliphilus]EPA00007.1 Type I restriction-modification system, specificity subunit S [Indibacter alkaliphilus LW1]